MKNPHNVTRFVTEAPTKVVQPRIKSPGPATVAVLQQQLAAALEANRPLADWFFDVQMVLDRIIVREHEKKNYARQASQAKVSIAEMHERACLVLQNVWEEIQRLPGLTGHEYPDNDELEAARVARGLNFLRAGVNVLADDMIPCPFCEREPHPTEPVTAIHSAACPVGVLQRKLFPEEAPCAPGSAT